MLLIAILFCLALQRFANVGGWFQASWFEAYLRYLGQWVSKLDDRLIILVVIIPILLLFVLMHFIFMWRFFGLFDLILSILVLFFCIDARDLKTKSASYFNALEKSDMHTASSVVTDFIDDAVIGNMADLHRAVTRAILLKSFEQIFVGLFWFIVFGIYGVATYFTITLLRQNALKVNPNYVELAKLAAKIQDILEWIPSRLLGFTYALVGHFNEGFNYCVKHLWSGLGDVKRFTVESGLAALDVGSTAADADRSENFAALDIINRVLIIWLIAVALILIGILL
ncbi:MAG: regulatory signaling modulator protein AmpE [Coxiellaceae bacterium]|jgi:membrane protein required for beta-lactamase induction|nr:regulatory signaling modulator protein AmpE [Coxiellaceae bacterium]